MDSPDLLRLAFLLLAVAAPHPNIAMYSDDPAEGTQDSYFGKTTVTVYHCKDCESSTCKPEGIRFENFEVIAKTQNKRFSDGTIELVTTETHVTVCLQQASFFPEGVFGIVWENAGGVGLSCGILNSGAFSENGSGNITIEEKKICCEAETDLWEPNPTLKWYTKPSGPKASTPPADIPDDPETPTHEKDIIGIFFLVAILWVLTIIATMYCFFWHRCGQAFQQDRWAPDEEHLTYV